MTSPARKTSKARTRSRRASTFKLGLPGVVECPKCHEMKLSHRVCKKCGTYGKDGKIEVIATEAE